MAPRKKPPRRKPGTGAIRFKRGREKPYEAAFPLGGREYRYEYFTTAEEAAAHLDRLVAERDHKETPRNVKQGSQTVTQFLTAWLGIKAAHVAPKTLEDYKYQCELAISEIGSCRLDQVDLMMADTMLARFARQGYKGVKQMRMVLKQAFEYAEENDYIKKNPFRRSTAPAVKRRKAIALTQMQRAALLEAAAQETAADGMPLEPFWHLCSRLAFRRGEALGVRWSDIDFEKATITIAQQRTQEGTHTITKGAPKGGDDKVRTVPIPDDILDMLRQFKKDQIKRAAADPEWITQGATSLIFVGEHGRAPAAITANRRLVRLVERVNEQGGTIPTDLHVHDLRHTALTILALSGVPANVRKALSGHSTAKMDEHYTSHARIEDVRRALG